MQTKPAPGTRVQFTAAFLRNTGQYTGRSTKSKWLVLECNCGLCRDGDHCAVDERSPYYAGEYPEGMERPSQWRHIAWANLELARGGKAKDCPKCEVGRRGYGVAQGSSANVHYPCDACNGTGKLAKAKRRA